MTLRLDQWLHDLPDVPTLAVRDLVLDSRQASAGDVFIALAGSQDDGAAHLSDAQRRGAVVALVERPVPSAPLPVVVVPQLKREVGARAAAFYGKPGDAVRCIGITGTNGKTSIAYYLADLASRLGQRCGYLGTIGWGEVGGLVDAGLTTPDPVMLQRRLAALRDRGVRWVAMEVSSHALDQGRVNAVPFRAAAFSTLPRDHLDYHGTMEAYAAAKARLFAWPTLETVAVNVDDPFGRELTGRIDPGVQCLTCGAQQNVASPMVAWSNLRFDLNGVRGRWHTPWGETDFALPVHAPFSVANVAIALALLGDAGASLHDIGHAARTLAQVPGRLEYLRAAGRPTVVIDFAHTPDALLQVLTTLKQRSHGRLVCGFGCGGARDRGKRSLMAAAAETAADVVWLTSDNPRSEDPLAIIAEMRAGISGRVCARA
ncbi:MAG: Mur ligase family protein, partial [Pseudomonadales bacterium]